MNIQDAKELCPELVVIHVATYKEGEKEPGYWENPDSRTHKVNFSSSSESLFRTFSLGFSRLV